MKQQLHFFGLAEHGEPIVHWSGEPPPGCQYVLGLDLEPNGLFVPSSPVIECLVRARIFDIQMYTECQGVYMIYPRPRIVEGLGFVTQGPFNDVYEIVRVIKEMTHRVWTRWVFVYQDEDRVWTQADDLFLSSADVDPEGRYL